MNEVRQDAASHVVHYDVIIVGAGIAGCALALALGGQRLRIAVIESRPLALPVLPMEWSVQHFDSRVSALTPRSSRFLKDLGAWQAIVDYRHCPYGHMTVWDAQGTGQIEFDRAEVDAAELGYIVENRAIVNALLQQVMACREVDLLSGVAMASCERQDDSSLQLALADGAFLSAGLLIAADGALSPVRQSMQFETKEWDYGHHAIVATVETSESHANTALQRFLPSGPLALLPLPERDGQTFCSIVWSVNEAMSKDLLALEDAAFCAALTQASEARLGDILAASERASFPLRQRHAVDYVQPGVALVGDAAHTIHPLAGQGINLGLQDVAVLAEEIARAKEQGVAPGQLQSLKRYQRRRKGENLLMMAAMEGFKRLFEEPSLPLRWLRNAGMRGVDQALPLKQQLMRHAMGLD